MNRREDSVLGRPLQNRFRAGVCTLLQIRSMVDEMLGAQARWLPQFSPEERTEP
ncbi:MAG: hypothetical protein M3Q62_01235 [Actinomycetota bacterium]|nr:hypothetical protein [Actinomycetota bacterium]MDQ3496317.1 hypothetical protein [Actinomycetota bacterium]